MTLSEDDLQRYDRQIRLPGFGLAAQERLAKARVLCVGAGGLGSPAALYLAAAGVGTIALVDDDQVSLSNLQRQILFTTSDAGRAKAEAGAERLRALNPRITVRSHLLRLNLSSAAELIPEYDVIIDGTDNFTSRGLIARACHVLRKTHVYGGISGFEGQVAVFRADDGPCYRCLVPTLPSAGEVPNCNESGVIGALAGIVGSMQALRAIQEIADLKGRTASGALTVFDGLTLGSSTWQVPKRPKCLVCGDRSGTLSATSDEIEAPEVRAGIPWPANAVWLDVRTGDEVVARPLAGARHVPIAELESRARELCPQTNYVVVCASGQRSRRAQELLLARGFRGVWNLRGGLLENRLTEVPR